MNSAVGVRGIIPEHVWRRKLDARDPPKETHTFARPPLYEILTLLPVAWRVSSYIRGESSSGRQPIFDLQGIFLDPPTPGPHAGVPLGGIGSGCIGRGWRGEFNRWSLHHGRYVHRAVESDRFFVRVKRQGEPARTQVLSVHKCCDETLKPVPRGSVTYHAIHPRAWHVFEEPVPGVRVIIRQLSPFIPGSYSEASLPVSLFHVNVVNLLPGLPIEASVMLTFENGTPELDDNATGGFVHTSFSLDGGDSDIEIPRCESQVSGVSMTNHSGPSGTLAPYRIGSFAIAAESGGTNCKTSHFKQFVIRNTSKHASCCESLSFFVPPVVSPSKGKKSKVDSEMDCISLFQRTGDLLLESKDGDADCPLNHKPSSSLSNAVESSAGEVVGAAVCIKKQIAALGQETFSFSLAWDNPHVFFGGGLVLPHYYTRFFGKSGDSAAVIASYALLNSQDWEDRIVSWQTSVVDDISNSLGTGTGTGTGTANSVPDFYKSNIFNELYYLCDGGTVWTDSSGGQPNCVNSTHTAAVAAAAATISVPSNALYPEPDMDRSFVLESNENDFNFMHRGSVCITHRMLANLAKVMRQHDDAVHHGSLGDSRLVGQILILEGHEYAMFNTYDVHFYSSFALALLWPHLEYSLQRDVATAVTAEDLSIRIMLGTGLSAVRKSKNCVPHDMGSPSELPFAKTNSYLFQSTSQWVDLGPKFVLQIYRDFLLANAGKTESVFALKFLAEMYEPIKAILTSMLNFDLDGDGMIENSGTPDQTYDIWSATGKSAYCGGLYIASLFAASAIANALQDKHAEEDYTQRALRAQLVYHNSLWNGSYLNYDSSSSAHSNSIMADMMAGQWWTRVCSLPAVMSPQAAFSCYRKIFDNNVVKFADICNKEHGSIGENCLRGAVNGMRPDGKIDDTCLQSREVWTGTTYGLAAAMMHESYADEHQVEVGDDCMTGFAAFTETKELEDYSPLQPLQSTYSSLPVEISNKTPLGASQRRELQAMAFSTAQGIHDAGWQAYGYQFATPEAWTANGNYRALGYMRPLAIWAMQFPSVQRKHLKTKS